MSKNIEYLLEAYKKGYLINNEGVLFNPNGVVVNGSIDTKGYKTFSIRFNGKVGTVHYHRLQAFQKFGEIIFLREVQVRHLDGNSLNNSELNITIGTQSQNMMDKSPEARKKSALHASSFLKKYDNDAVKDYYKEHGFKKAMEHFGISSKGTMSYIINH